MIIHLTTPKVEKRTLTQKAAVLMATVALVGGVAVTTLPSVTQVKALVAEVVTPPTPPTPPTPVNRSPKFISIDLPVGYVGQSYKGRIIAGDLDIGDLVGMEILDLPEGLTKSSCVYKTVKNRSVVACNITGTPQKAGVYTIRAVAGDNHGARTVKKLPLTISK